LGLKILPFEPIKRESLERTRRDAGMLEGAVGAHAEPLHHRDRAGVDLRRKGDDLRRFSAVESEGERRARRFGGVADRKSVV